MPSVYSLLTFDYELFGNGTGDIVGCMVDPTNQLVQLLDKYGVHATFFVDVCLLWAIEANEAAGAFKDSGFSPSQMIRRQMVELVASGHDVQMHAHPQFIGAGYDEHGFEVSDDHWRIGDFPSGEEGGGLLSVEGLLKQGKRTLESMIRDSWPSYRTIAFRAGMFCSRPEAVLFRAMRRVGLRFDFSGAFDFKVLSGIGSVDFTDAFPTPDPMPVGDTYEQRPAESDLIALPIYGARYRWWSEFGTRTWIKLGWASPPPSWARRHPPGCTGASDNREYSLPAKQGTWKRFFRSITMHFSLQNGKHTMVFCTKDAISRQKRLDRDIYMVGIGHPKAMGDLSQLESYLQWASTSPRRKTVRFVTVRDISDHTFVGKSLRSLEQWA